MWSVDQRQWNARELAANADLPRPTKSEPTFEQNPQVISVHVSLRSIGSDCTEKTLVSKVELMIEAGVFGLWQP